MASIRDQVFVVTGGGGAIARPILQSFVAAGAKVVAADRTAEIAARAADTGASPLAADLSSAAGAAAMVRATVEKFGAVDGLIHTVGGFAMGPLVEADDAAYERMFDLNVRTLFHAIRAVVPGMIERKRGFVAAFSSEPGWSGAAPGSALYGASKSAVATLLRSLDGELRASPVRVAIVYPMGAVDTPANRRDMPSVDPATYIDPVEIAETLRFAAERGPRARLLELPVFPGRPGGSARPAS
ncbi:MAG TPA: SDR family NAD(P)-dependent oxidoreductase [Polyangia bacterium]|nr:SDR family NAD(P)-dependent oxidoreductase [Polyangia bacterium]